MIRCVCVLVVLLLARITAGSEIVFSNLGPSYSFAQLSGQIITGPDADLGGIHPGNYDAGVMFVVSLGQNYTLETIEVPLALYEGADSMAVRVYSDAGGVPGSELGSVLVTGITPTPTLFAADFSAQAISLTAGTSYWVVGDAAQDTSVFWYWNETGQLGGAYRTNGPWIHENLGATPGVRVSGAAVPETSSLMLVAIAFFGLFGRRRAIVGGWMTGDLLRLDRLTEELSVW
jgi:hypothetical protein